MALADHGHFGRAAEACFVTQSTLSTQLKKLEDSLGVALIDRSVKRVRPTPIGREIVAAARRILEGADGIGDLAKSARDPMARTVRFGVIPTLGPYYLPRVLTRVHKAHPELRLLLREELTPQILEHLEDGRLDAALVALPVEEGGLAVETLFYEPFLAALPSGHPLAERESVKVKDLTEENLLLLDEGHCLREQALELCGSASPAREEIRATSLETLRQMVGMGLGVTLLPILSVDAGPRDRKGAVTVRPFARPSPGRTIAMVWRRRAPRAETFARLSQTLKDALPGSVAPV